VLQVNGISLHIEDHGGGRPVLLLHGWPDSTYLWRHQILFLAANGFRVIAPDCVASGARIGRREWPRIPCSMPSAILGEGPHHPAPPTLSPLG